VVIRGLPGIHFGTIGSKKSGFTKCAIPAEPRNAARPIAEGENFATSRTYLGGVDKQM
jgi:hypothetical protein